MDLGRLAAFFAVFLFHAVPAWGAVDAPALEIAIADRLMRVEELRFLRKAAETRNVRVFLFGGTAAGFAHYVKWDLEREGGDTRFQPDRFDYDYTNIFRSTQDVDLVIDGDESVARELENEVREQYRYLEGNKSKWEVRLFHGKRQDKEALDAPGFLNQSTDSNSTGMIELTVPRAGESVVRDARDMESPRSRFFSDVLSGTLHYYHSDAHWETDRAKRGLNPPILSVIRYFTKAFQYELRILPEDRERIAAVIGDFKKNSVRYLAVPYVREWLEKNGRKLFQHAVNVELAAAVLDEAGLRETLIGLSEPKRVGTMGWWLNRKPLPSRPVGRGDGPTAVELGIEVVAHETRDFLAYESITRAHTGDPNVFVSRKSTEGEAALYGEGFYTKRGRSGAVGTGITIRFTVDPGARLGEDFFLGGTDFVIFTNKRALRVIPESLNLGPVEFFQWLSEGKELEKDDRAILEKMKRRIGHRLTADPVMREAIADTVRKAIRSRKVSRLLIEEWLALPGATAYADILELLTDRHYGEDKIVAGLLTAILRGPALEPATRKRLVEGLLHLDRGHGLDMDFLSAIRPSPELVANPEYLTLAHHVVRSRRSYPSQVAARFLDDPAWVPHPEAVKVYEAFYAGEQRKINSKYLLHLVLNPLNVSGKLWSRTEEGGRLIEAIARSAKGTSEEGEVARGLTSFILIYENWKVNPYLKRKYQGGLGTGEDFMNLVVKPGDGPAPSGECVKALAERG